MKTLKELGTSPMPWSANVRHPGYVLDADDEVVVKELRGMDARLIAASPELYDALFRIVSAEDDSVGDFDQWRENLHAALRDARKALAKASGEENQ